MTNDRTRHIPAAEDFANKLHGKLTDAGSYSVLGPETRARWNRAFHSAMQLLVAGKTPTVEQIDYTGLRWSSLD